VWPAADEAAALVKELAGRGFGLLDARGSSAPEARQQAAEASVRRALRSALDPVGAFALGT
jgi:hypothetical protein